MSRKTSPARRGAFLQALRETGNQTIAAERAKVSRSWVQLHRSTDPQFRADVAAAARGPRVLPRLRSKPSRGRGQESRFVMGLSMGKSCRKAPAAVAIAGRG